MKITSKFFTMALSVALMACCLGVMGCGSQSNGTSSVPDYVVETIGYDDVSTIVVKVTNNTDKCIVIGEEGSLVASFADANGKILASPGVVPNDPIYVPAGQTVCGVVFYSYEGAEEYQSISVSIDTAKVVTEDVTGMDADSIEAKTLECTTGKDSMDFSYDAKYVGDDDKVNGFRFVAYALDKDGNLLMGEQLVKEFGSDKSEQAGGTYGDLAGIAQAEVFLYPAIAK